MLIWKLEKVELHLKHFKAETSNVKSWKTQETIPPNSHTASLLFHNLVLPGQFFPPKRCCSGVKIMLRKRQREHIKSKYFKYNNVHIKDTILAQNSTEENWKNRGNIKTNLCCNSGVSAVNGTHFDSQEFSFLRQLIQLPNKQFLPLFNFCCAVNRPLLGDTTSTALEQSSVSNAQQLSAWLL